MIRSFIRNMAGLVRHGKGRERGAAIIETALTLPLLLLVALAIFEFGHAFQTWQVLTNAAREGARLAVLSGSTDAGVATRVQDYLTAGAVADPVSATVVVQRNVAISGTAGLATTVTVTYPFQFMVLQPVAQMVLPSATVGSPTMRAVATMRNET